MTEPRICLLSQRRLRPSPVMSAVFEFEDVVGTVDDTAIVEPTHSWSSRTALRGLNKVAHHSRYAARTNPCLGHDDLVDDVELFCMVAGDPVDLFSLKAVSGWRAHSRRAVCLLNEIWLEDIQKYANLIRLLNQFDHVFIAYYESVEAVQDLLDVPCSFLAPSVDAALFAPAPPAPKRWIDVSNIGRRSELLHDALVEAMRRGDLMYNYTTVQPDRVWDASEHRLQLAEILKRSRYAVVNRAKFNESRHSQEEIGYRYFESAAAGAVMLGPPVRNAMFRQLFDWTDAVIEVSEPDIVAALADLDRQIDRLDEIRRQSVATSLRRHDHVHRWRHILSVIGLDLSAAAAERIDRLEALAQQVETAPSGPARPTRRSSPRPRRPPSG